MGLFDIKPYKPGKKSKHKSIKSIKIKPFSINSKSKPFKMFTPVKIKPFSPINSKPSKSKPTGLFTPVKMVPIKITPISNSKPKNLIFGFDIPKNKTKSKGKKSLSWNQAKVKFPKLSPFGDVDKDGVKNWLDCRPFDPKRQALKDKRSYKQAKKLYTNLDLLQGQEFLSIPHEGYVAVEGTKVWSRGKVIDKIDSPGKAKKLFDAMYEDETGYAPGSKANARMMEEEFGGTPSLETQKEISRYQSLSKKQKEKEDLDDSLSGMENEELKVRLQKAYIDEETDENPLTPAPYPKIYDDDKLLENATTDSGGIVIEDDDDDDWPTEGVGSPLDFAERRTAIAEAQAAREEKEDDKWPHTGKEPTAEDYNELTAESGSDEPDSDGQENDYDEQAEYEDEQREEE